MTRTELIILAQSVIRNPLDVYDDFGERGTVFTSTYRKKAISVFRSLRNVIIAVAYNSVCYFVNATDLNTAQNLRHFCHDNKVTTRVFLYSRSTLLFKDNDGAIEDRTEMKISKALDYADVIPIPF